MAQRQTGCIMGSHGILDFYFWWVRFFSTMKVDSLKITQSNQLLSWTHRTRMEPLNGIRKSRKIGGKWSERGLPSRLASLSKHKDWTNIN